MRLCCDGFGVWEGQRRREEDERLHSHTCRAVPAAVGRIAHVRLKKSAGSRTMVLCAREYRTSAARACRGRFITMPPPDEAPACDRREEASSAGFDGARGRRSCLFVGTERETCTGQGDIRARRTLRAGDLAAGQPFARSAVAPVTREMRSGARAANCSGQAVCVRPLGGGARERVLQECRPCLDCLRCPRS